LRHHPMMTDLITQEITIGFLTLVIQHLQSHQATQMVMAMETLSMQFQLDFTHTVLKTWHNLDKDKIWHTQQ